MGSLIPVMNPSYPNLNSHDYPRIFFLNVLLLMLIPILFSGCVSQERVENTGELAKEIKSLKIKRFTQAELNELLLTTGQEMVSQANQAIENSTEANCGDSLEVSKAKQLGAEISLLFAKDTADANLHAKEIELLQAYAYQSRQGQPLPENLQKLNDSLTVFYAPLPTTSKLYQQCEEAAPPSFALWRVMLNQKEVIKNAKN